MTSSSSAKDKEKFYEARNSRGLDQKAIDLLIKYEVGGGKSYYDRYLRKPTWPGASSGVTVGIGYDLGYKSLNQIQLDWKGVVPQYKIDWMKGVHGLKKSAAKGALGRVDGLRIDWDDALEIFKKTTVPRFRLITEKTFPGVEKLHPYAYGALVSLVFNRGGSVNGSRRLEMFKIKGLVAKKDYSGIAREIRAMKRLWSYKTLKGLHLRRDAEAKMVDSAAKL